MSIQPPVEGYALSRQQARLYAFQQVGTGYHAQCALLLEGTIQPLILQQAFQQIVTRHSLFCTRFQRRPGLDLPVQTIEARATMDGLFVNLEAVQGTDAPGDVTKAALFAAIEPYLDALPTLAAEHAGDAPLFFILLQTTARSAVLLLHFSALSADAATLPCFAQELAAFYTAALRNQPMPLDDVLQYREVAAWQDDLLHADGSAEHIQFWSTIDTALCAGIPLPFADDQQVLASLAEEKRPFQPLIFPLVLEEAASTGIQRLATTYACSQEAVLLASWQLLLWHLNRGAAALTGVACNGRDYEELATLPGPYTRFVPIIGNFAATSSFVDILQQVWAALQAAREEQWYFDWSHLAVIPTATDNGHSFFPFNFEYTEWPAPFSTEEVTFSLLSQFVCSEPFLCKLQALQQEEKLVLAFHYRADTIEVRTIQQLAVLFVHLLRQCLSSPELALGQMTLLAESEQRGLEDVGTGTLMPITPADLLLRRFETWATTTPQVLAIICGQETLTYQQLNQQAEVLARALIAQGVRPNMFVGLYLERSAAFFVALLAVLKSGGAYVPLDVEQPLSRLTGVLDDLKPALIITQRIYKDRLIDYRVLSIDEPGELASGTEAVMMERSLTHLAYVIYTSGSTGMPKGVMIQQEGVANYTRSLLQLLQVQAGWQFAIVSTLAADLGNTAIFGALASGGTLHVLDYSTALSGEAFATYLEQHPIDVLKIVPSHFSALLSSIQGASARLLPQKYLILGGELLTGSLLARIVTPASPCRLVNHYGPTETTVGSLVYVLGTGSEIVERMPHLLTDLSIPVGRPLANTRALILNPWFQRVPAGMVGELFLGGKGVASGYLYQSEQTRERFLIYSNQQGQQERVYRTGDLVYWREDGLIEFVGRGDEQVKVRGFRVEMGEIEEALARHSSVWDCAVALSQAAPDTQHLVAYVVLKQPLISPDEELRQFLQARLPEYMLPAAFVYLKELPLTHNGKIDRQRLPLAEVQNYPGASEYVAPRTPLEETLAEIFATALALKRVSVEDNFFHVGGHSLIAMRVIVQIKTALQVDLPVLRIFEAPTVSALAQSVQQEIQKTQAVETLPLMAVSRTQDLLLSFSQQRLWFLDQLDPGQTSYIVPLSLSLKGALSVSTLLQSVQTIVRRHEILRTAFQMKQDQPVQVISPRCVVPFVFIDLICLETSQQEQTIRHLMQQEQRLTFNLQLPPFFRMKLVRVNAEEHVLLFTMHHSISDEWSRGILLRELIGCYEAFQTGEPACLPELPLQYADFALWQRQWLQGDVLEERVRYWSAQLAGIQPLNLPTDHPRPRLQTFHGASLRQLFPQALCDELKQFSLKEGATLYMTLLAAFQVLLAQYCGQDDIAVGSPIANRNHSALENLIGFFMNTLVLRARIVPHMTFRDLVAQVRETCLQAYAHQDLPFEKLVEVLHPERDLSRSPLFQVLFVLQQASAAERAMGGLTIENHAQRTTTAKFDLTLFVAEQEQGLRCSIEYNTDLFEQATIKRLLMQWHTLLQVIVTTPDLPIARLPLLPDTERQQVLHIWNATRTVAPPKHCLHTLFETSAAAFPDTVALASPEGLLTYTCVERLANRLAQQLGEEGVTTDTLVALCLERSVEQVVSVLAVLKAGGAYVPLDPTYPTERLAFMLATSQARVLVTHSRLQATLPAFSGQILLLNSVLNLSPLTSPFFTLAVDPEALAYVIYTSGSSGEPKGIAMPHRGLVNLIHWQHQHSRLTVGARTVQYTSLSFDVACQELFATWGSAGTLVLIQEEVRQSPQTLLYLLDLQGIERLFLPFVALQQLLSTAISTETLPQALREVITAGEQLQITGDIRQAFQQLCDAQLVNQYGPAESHVVTAQELNPPADLWPALPTIGRPVANTQIYLMTELGEPVPIGFPGEIYIGGAGLARGYLRRSDLTAERFVPDPFQPGGRLYRSGDLGRYLPDGRIEFLGRADQQIKVRGYRVEPGEIEMTLVQHPAIREAVVVVREGEQQGRQLVAYVIPAAQGAGEATQMEQTGTLLAGLLRAFLEKRLPDYMLPTSLVVLPVFPLTPSGKVDRRALPAPTRRDTSLVTAFVAPRTEIEELLVEHWRDLLGLPSVSIDDNFFAAGGHSLLATRAISHIRAVLRVDLPLRAIFEAPTVAGLAARIEQLLHGQHALVLPPLVPFARGQAPVSVPLSFAQQRVWFIDQFLPQTTMYTLSGNLIWPGELQYRALEQSLQAIVHRHESLRTTFQAGEDGPVQVIHAEFSSLPLPIIDLCHLPDERCQQETRRLSRQLVLRPFDLGAGPLLRVLLLKMDDDIHLCYFTMHHIISDGWSLDIFRHEMKILYQAYSTGAFVPLAPLPVQYADMALWQKAWLQEEILARQMHYWQHQLQDVAPLHLPVDHPYPPVQAFRGARQQFLVPRALHDQLTSFAQEEGLTFFMLLLAVFQILLARSCGQEDIAVGTPIAGRNQRELEGIIGFFVNTLVIRVKLEEQLSARQLLERVRQVCLDAYAHQDVPFEKLVEILQPERDLSRSPLFQVMFALQQSSTEVNQSLAQHGSGARIHPSYPEVDTEGINAKYELSLIIRETAQGLSCLFEYSVELFATETIGHLFEHFQTLLQNVLEMPDQPLGLLPMLAPAEYHVLTQEWQTTTDVLLDYMTIPALFDTQLVWGADRVALDYEGHQLTYHELDLRARTLAQKLRVWGVQLEEPVGLYIERSIEMVIGILGILKAGALYVPLDPAYPPERVHFMIEDAAVHVVVTIQSLQDALPSSLVFCLDGTDLSVKASAADLPACDAQQIAYIMYTSGSTGVPKGIGIPQQAVVRLITSDTYIHFGPDEHFLQLAPISFDAATLELWGSLLHGARLVIPSARRLALDEIARILDVSQISVLWLTAGLFHLMVEQHLPALRGVRQVLAGGDVLSLSHVSAYVEGLDPRHVLVNGYGPTENTTFTCCYPMHADEAPAGSIPIGRPIAFTSVYVLDRFYQPVPIGVIGELYTGGDGLARGYWQKAALTAELFLPNPFSTQPGARLYRTGDLVRYRPDGNLEFVGRRDLQVKIRGFRVEVGEIETVLSQHADIQNQIVLVREDQSGEKRLVAYLVAEQERPASEWRSYLQERLPDYMIPAAFVTLSALPLTENGKIDRQALPMPDQDRGTTEFIPPRSAAEEVLVALWSEFLALEQVGVRDNFFMLGGHSLLATQIVSRMRSIFQVDFPLSNIFAFPTIEQLVQELALLLGTREVADEVAQIYLELLQLSDDEIMEELSQ